MQEKQDVRVLVVEDDQDDFFITQRLLSKTPTFSCEVDWAGTYQEGLDSITEENYDIGLIDYRLGARDGLELLREALQYGTEASLILLTGQGDLEVDLRAMAAGASDYLIKGEIDEHLLERSIRYAIDRKRALDRIQEQAALLDKARDIILEVDLEGSITYWNKGAERLTGWSFEEIVGERMEIRLCPNKKGQLEKAHRIVHEEGEWSGELCMLTRRGEELTVESRWTLVRNGNGHPQSILVISTDVTERKRLETQFLRSQRMDSIGRLVGGIAHDLGNLLAPITLGIKVLRSKIDDDSLDRTLDMIEKSSERGAEMVKQVLSFTRGVEGEREPLAPKEVMEEVSRITRETFPEGISITNDFDDETYWITGDSTQLQQVMMNLCVNARDAMPDGGSITLRARKCTITEEMAQQTLEADPGDYACMSVKDTGTGIPPELLDKIFEPFMTTKESGEGTGLGLSTVYSIVKSHEGFIDVESKQERGTTFYVYVPLATEEHKQPTPSNGQVKELARGDGEVLLVVDDEEFVLEMMCETLQSSGYSVLSATNGQEALEVYDANVVDAVLMDLMMPVMNGIEAIRKLRERTTNIPIIAASALSGEKPDEAMKNGADMFVSKPFTADGLCEVVHRALAAREKVGYES